MGINDYHLLYITNNVMLSFIKVNKIKVPGSSYNSKTMVAAINDFADESEINNQLLEQEIGKWLLQGRKKILFRYFTDRDMLFDKDNINKNIETINNLFTVTEVGGLINLCLLNCSRSLINLKCVSEKGSLNKIEFIFIEKVRQKIKDTEEYREIPLPVFIEINFQTLEIIARVCVKSDIYRLNGGKVEDIKIAQEILEYVLNKIKIEERISGVQKVELQRIIFSIHNEITALPEEIVQKADNVNEEIDEFIDKISQKIELINDETYKEEIVAGIKNVILKYIISMYDDKEIFKNGKYAISTGIDGSGLSRSKFQFHAPACEPVQSNPEYQNIRNILGDAEKIKKDVILWNSRFDLGGKIRLKMYAHQEGYIQICFEQYVYEEDIENVLSKIREFI